MRYAFYISGNKGGPCTASRLCTFIRQASSAVRQEIMLVFADENISADAKAAFALTPAEIVVVRYSDLPGVGFQQKNAVLSERLREALESRRIDYCISYGSHILSGRLLDDYCCRLINFHPAVLPMYPGNRAIDQAVAHGNTLVVGNTCHFIDAGVDTGPIIMQSIVPLKTFFNHDGDYSVVLDLQVEMLNRLIRVIDEGRLTIVDGKPVITGADYDTPRFFPDV